MSTSSLEYGKVALLALLLAGVVWLATSPISFKTASSGSVGAVSATKSSEKGVPTGSIPAGAGLSESGAYSDWDYIDGKKHVANSRYEEAVNSFALAMKSNKRNSYASYERGLALTELKRYDEAIADFTKAIAINATNKEFYFGRADAFKAKKDFARAIEDCNLVIREFGDSADVQQHIALVCIDKEEFQPALQAVDTANKLAEKDAYTWNLRGICDEGLNKKEAAIADYAMSIGLNDSYAEPLNNRGVIYLDKHEYQKALNDFDRVVKLSQATGEHYYNRSLAYAGLGRKALADADLKKSQELKYDPNKGE